MTNCPNKSFKSSPDQLFTDWEFLVGRFGEDQAYAYWLANGEVIPNPNEVDALTDVVISNYATQSELTKGYNFLTDSKGNLMPSKYVEQFTASLTKLLFEIQKERKLSVLRITNDECLDLDSDRLYKMLKSCRINSVNYSAKYPNQ